MTIRQGVSNRLAAYRNPVYLAYGLVGLAVLIPAALIARGGVGPIEEYLFRIFNNLGPALERLFWTVSLFGTIGMVAVVAALSLLTRHYANALKVLLAGVGAYIAAYSLKLLDIRARPSFLLDDVTVRERGADVTMGFPSGHAAVATVLALTAYQYLPRRWHRPVTILALLVMISRLYMGVHLPLDLVGGFAIGLLFGGVVNFAFGSRKFSPVPPSVVKNKLKALSVPVRAVKLAAVDARGSTPYLVELTGNKKVFVKVVGRENTVADWLFRLYRKLRYRRLRDESPFLNAKHQLEHEAYVSNLAKIAGVRTPGVLYIFEAKAGRWAHAQEGLDGASLDRQNPKAVTDRILDDAWRQVGIMHRANIVHGDLRTANLFLDGKKQIWLIDFSFAEASTPPEAAARDNAELLGSLTTLVGPERAAQSAIRALSKDELQTVYHYLDRAVFSGATATALKASGRPWLKELRAALIKHGGLTAKHTARPKRQVSKKALLIVAGMFFLFFFVPQLSSLKDSVASIQDAHPGYLLLAAVASVLTYAASALGYKALLFYPIEMLRLLLVQVASSFASKLAPASTGGLALNARFLAKQGHSGVQASSIVAINNILGLVAHLSVLVFVALVGPGTVASLFPDEIDLPAWVWFVGLGGLVLVVAGMVANHSVKKAVTRAFSQLTKTLQAYRAYPYRIAASYAASILVTLAYCAALYASAAALGVHLSPLQVITVFTVGTATAAITPTPGGVGGAEAGLTAALAGTGLSTDQAFAITLVYRLFTYWLPIIPGFIAFRHTVNKEYV